METDGGDSDRNSWTHEEATMGRGQEGATAGWPRPALGFLCEGQAGGWNRGRKREANKGRTAPRMRPEQLAKGGLLRQVREASGGEVGDRERLGCRETREGLRPGAWREPWKGLGA